MDSKLPHDVVSTCAKRDEPPSRRSRLHHSRSTFFHLEILRDVVGPATRLFCLFSVFCGLNFRALSCLSWFQTDTKKAHPHQGTRPFDSPFGLFATGNQKTPFLNFYALQIFADLAHFAAFAGQRRKLLLHEIGRLLHRQR